LQGLSCNDSLVGIGDDLEDASFGLHGGVSSLIEQTPHVTVALRRAVTVVHPGGLFFAGAGTDRWDEKSACDYRKSGGVQSATIK